MTYKNLICKCSELLIVVTIYAGFVTTLEAANPVTGQGLFMQHCNSCHEPGNPVAGSPDFSDINSMIQPDIVLLKKIQIGQGAMPAYDGILSAKEIMDVIAYMRTL
ncbi:MAG: cytochrome c [Gammaproteobacteria bacterium]|nr:cytochrome c [Gammaproteobacteria bacterium]